MPMLIPLSVLSNRDLGVRLHFPRLIQILGICFCLLVCVAPRVNFTPFLPPPPPGPEAIWCVVYFRLSPQVARLFTGLGAVQFYLFFTFWLCGSAGSCSVGRIVRMHNPLISHVLLFSLGYDAHAVWKSWLLIGPDSGNSPPRGILVCEFCLGQLAAILNH